MKLADLNTIIELAKEVENGDPIDWGMLAVNEDDAYKLIATSMLEYFICITGEDRELAMMATIVKLAVENFVLNLKLAAIQNANTQ